MVLSRLSYPDRLINSTISRFIAVKASDQPVLKLPALHNEVKAVPVVVPFKDQSSADIVRAQKIQATVQPVFLSHKPDTASETARSRFCWLHAATFASTR